MRYNKKTILLFSFLFLISGGGYFIYRNNIKNNLGKLTESDEIISRIKSTDVSVSIQNNDSSSFKWIKDGYTVLVPSTASFVIKKRNVKNLESDTVTTLFNKEISIINNVLKDRGYILDQENSSKDFGDQSFYDYVLAYRQGAGLCVVSVNPDDIGSYQLDFSCGDSLEKEYQNQLPFLKILKLKDRKTSARARSQKDNYYEIEISRVRSGSIAVLKKENDTYRILYIGQEAPQCSLIKNESIPNEVLISIGGGNCFANDGSYVKK